MNEYIIIDGGRRRSIKDGKAPLKKLAPIFQTEIHLELRPEPTDDVKTVGYEPKCKPKRYWNELLHQTRGALANRGQLNKKVPSGVYIRTGFVWNLRIFSGVRSLVNYGSPCNERTSSVYVFHAAPLFESFTDPFLSWAHSHCSNLIMSFSIAGWVIIFSCFVVREWKWRVKTMRIIFR